AIGREAKVEMAVAVEGRKRFRGEIEEVAMRDGALRAAIRFDDDAVADLAVVEMAEARLVATEDMLRASLREGKAAEAAAKEKARAGRPARGPGRHARRAPEAGTNPTGGAAARED
ncbi:MAG: ribosome maturation factor, partial [Hyphomicrobiales bacterium]|nr:ribosome maturation factor [Hyphomicrobiales bacterium]